MADQRSEAAAESCPRCGALLRFEDEGGAECVCGWSPRSPDAAPAAIPVTAEQPDDGVT